MRTKPPLLLPLFRSAGQARLLARLFIGDAEGVPLTTLAEQIEVAPSRVYEEAERLEAAGLIRSERVGNVRLLRPDEESPFYPELRGLLLKAFGPVAVLEALLRDVPGIEEAFIYGSWATRYLGEPGDAPEDIDVLVIGAPDVDRVRAACRRAARQLGRDVNPTIVTRDEWETSATGFLRTLKKRPRVRLDISVE